MPSAVEHVEQALDVVGGVDHDRLAGLAIADEVDEVDHLAGDRIRAGEVATGEQLAEVQAVVHILCTLWRGASMRSASTWAACWWSPTTVCSAAALDDAGIAHDRDRFGVGPLPGHGGDGPGRRPMPEDFTDYLRGFLAAVGVPDGRPGAGARPARLDVLRTPVWCQPVPGFARRAARPRTTRACAWPSRRTATARWPITSPATSGCRWATARACRWRWSPTRASSASASPTRGSSRPRSTRSTCAPERILHVGDSVHYDVDGGAAVGHADGPHGPVRAVRVDRPPARRGPSTSCSTLG